MGTDHRGQRYCDNCGGLFDKAVRVHLGAEYCRRCYGENFVACTCSRCNGAMRRHRLEPPNGLCGSCVRAERVCLRCGRLTPRAARLVDGKAVCSGCVGYFNDEEKCSICSRLTRRTFSSLLIADPHRGASAEDDGGLEVEPEPEGRPICQPCRNKATHATCSVCRRHRRVDSERDGRPLCSACAAPVPLTHACPSCGDVVAGDGLGKCMACVQKQAALSRARVLQAGLEQPWCRELWEGYVAVLTTPPSPLVKASARVSAAFPYFQLVDAAFKHREQLTVRALHTAIDSPTHRRHLLAYRFLLGQLGTSDAAPARDKSNEARRLAEVMARASGRPYQPLLQAYVETLQRAAVADKTVRLYAGVAQSFCERAGVTTQKPWRREAVVSFLADTPGAANSLSRFVTHCRTTQSWDVTMPSKADRGAGKAKLERSVDRLRRALNAVRGRPVEELKFLELVRVISAATGLTMTRLASARAADATFDAAAVAIDSDTRIEPGHLLHPYAVRWQRLLELRGKAGRVDTGEPRPTATTTTG